MKTWWSYKYAKINSKIPLKTELILIIFRNWQILHEERRKPIVCRLSVGLVRFKLLLMSTKSQSKNILLLIFRQTGIVKRIWLRLLEGIFLKNIISQDWLLMLEERTKANAYKSFEAIKNSKAFWKISKITARKQQRQFLREQAEKQKIKIWLKIPLQKKPESEARLLK